MTDVNLKSESARSFFDKPERYLKNSVGINLRVQIAREMLGDTVLGEILDVGCGNGAISLPFLQTASWLTMVDISPEMLEIARANVPIEFTEKVELVKSDIHSMPINKQYDVVLCFGLLAHVADPAITIEKLANLTRLGGVCILQLTDQSSLIARINHVFYLSREKLRPLYGYQLTRMHSSKIVQLALENGFHVEAQCRYSVVLPGMGRLPASVFERIQKLSMESHFLSSIGSEVVLMLRKTRV